MSIQKPAEEVGYHKPIRGTKLVSGTLNMLFINLHVSGRENIPEETPVLITINHLGYMDVPAVAVQFDRRRYPAGFSAKKYKGTWLELFFRVGSPIWVEQDSPDRAALRQATQIIQGGYNVVIAPEGHRSKTGQLQKARDGAAFLANRNNMPILPIGVWGTEQAFKKFRPRAYVRIGKAFRLPEGRVKSAQLEAYTDRIMCAIAALIPEQYHGHYRDNPLIEEMRATVAPETL